MCKKLSLRFVAISLFSLVFLSSSSVFNISLAGWTLFKPKSADTNAEEIPAADFYRAMYKYSIGKYDIAITEFEQFETKYPNSASVKEAQIMIIFLKYLRREYQDAISLGENFKSLHPNSEYMAYIDFLTALCNKQQITGITKTYEVILKSKDGMDNVVQKYPNSIYATRAKQISKNLDSLLTYNKFLMAEDYFHDKDYFAAILGYQKTLLNEIALLSKDFRPAIYYRLYECYTAINMNDLADKYKNLFNESIKNFDGDVSFRIEGIFYYEPMALKQAREAKKLAKKQAQQLRKQGKQKNSI